MYRWENTNMSITRTSKSSYHMLTMFAKKKSETLLCSTEKIFTVTSFWVPEEHRLLERSNVPNHQAEPKVKLNFIWLKHTSLMRRNHWRFDWRSLKSSLGDAQLDQVTAFFSDVTSSITTCKNRQWFIEQWQPRIPNELGMFVIATLVHSHFAWLTRVEEEDRN